MLVTRHRAGALAMTAALLVLLLAPGAALAVVPPVAVDDGYTVAEDGSLDCRRAGGVLSNDTDDDGDPLTAVTGG